MSTTAERPPDTSTAEVRRQAEAAGDAAPAWSATDDAARAAALRAVADALDGEVDRLVQAADAETSLGAVRLTGEVARTTGQLRMFADAIESGAHLGAIITEADPATARPDVRRMLIAAGPVAVFSASNFPFAFSVAGGDTASALAAGCPVVVKAHEGHPCTSQLTAEIVGEALRGAGAPDGVFSIVYGQAAGGALVTDPAIRAVGFTGSIGGARALMALVSQRPDPIPFYGELGSVNPVVVLPGAAAADANQIATGYAGALTLGAGQFCTNPGLMFIPDAKPLRDAISAAVADTHGAPMLTQRIRDQYEQRVAEPSWNALAELGRGSSAAGSPTPQVRVVPLDAFVDDAARLTEERFGPAGLVVTYDDVDALPAVLARLPGSLTGSVHADESELHLIAPIAAALRSRVGRLIFNGWPTGVAVCWAMHHGGPWPASTMPSSTSVGVTAIARWLIPLAYQNWPEQLLPEALRRDNPHEVPQLVQRATDIA